MGGRITKGGTNALILKGEGTTPQIPNGSRVRNKKPLGIRRTFLIAAEREGGALGGKAIFYCEGGGESGARHEGFDVLEEGALGNCKKTMDARRKHFHVDPSRKESSDTRLLSVVEERGRHFPRTKARKSRGQGDLLIRLNKVGRASTGEGAELNPDLQGGYIHALILGRKVG